jgi:hypothetical protein
MIAHPVVRVRVLAFAFLVLLLGGGPPWSVAQSGPKTAEPPHNSGEQPDAKKLQPSEAVRSSQVLVSGTNFPTEKQKIAIRLSNGEPIRPNAVGKDGKWFTFIIPPGTPLGRHTVTASFETDGKPKATVFVPVPSAREPNHPGQLNVVSESTTPLKLTAVDPLVGYPTNRVYGFRLIGEGFSSTPEDNVLILEGHGEIPVQWNDAAAKGEKAPGTITGRFVSTRQLEFSGLPQVTHLGQQKIRIRVGEQVSEAVPVTLAQVSRTTPLIVAVVVLAALAGIVWFLATRSLGTYDVAGQRYGAFALLFLDKETDTYSLSRLQFYLWTAAAIFGYVYLTIARSLIQWDFSFAQIPEGLPGIVMISASTTVLAQGVTAARGPKGAGPVQPSLADFVTSGGVVLPERLQFLVWTLLGVGTFLFLMLATDPAQIRDLPKIPEGFLYLMGISALGYLGGKLARKPGPIIDEIAAQAGSLTLDIRGRFLSQEASFRIDDTPITVSLDNPAPSVPAPTPQAVAAVSGTPPVSDARLVVLRRQSDADPTLAVELRLVITDGVKADLWKTGTHTLTLANPDGQVAVWPFQAKSAAIPHAP